MERNFTFRCCRYHRMDDIQLFQCTVSILSHSAIQFWNLPTLFLSFISTVRMDFPCTIGYMQWWFFVLLQMPFIPGTHCQPLTLSFGSNWDKDWDKYMLFLIPRHSCEFRICLRPIIVNIRRLLLAHYLLLVLTSLPKLRYAVSGVFGKIWLCRKEEKWAKFLCPICLTRPPQPQHIFAEWQLHYILRNTWPDKDQREGEVIFVLLWDFPSIDYWFSHPSGTSEQW